MTEQTTAAPPTGIQRWQLPLTALLFLGVTALVLMKIVPKFDEVFRQVKIPMPKLTSGLMSMSGFCCAYPALVALIVAGVPASIHGWHPRAVSFARVAMPILFLFTWGWMIVALFLPLIGTLEGIGSRR